MKEKGTNYEVGDSVVVKPGTKDPDIGTDISGWQGRIIEFGEYEGETTICITWDSITLKNMPLSLIEECEEAGLDWSSMYIGIDDVEPAPARDTEQDVERAHAEIEPQVSWIFLGEEGKRIREVLDGIDPDDEIAVVEAWEEHLAEKLGFPFEAKVSEYQERGPLRQGDRLKVKSIYEADEQYGIIVKASWGEEKLYFPLCDLEVIDKKSANYQLVKDYAIWFANR